MIDKLIKELKKGKRILLIESIVNSIILIITVVALVAFTLYLLFAMIGSSC